MSPTKHHIGILNTGTMRFVEYATWQGDHLYRLWFAAVNQIWKDAWCIPGTPCSPRSMDTLILTSAACVISTLMLCFWHLFDRTCSECMTPYYLIDLAALVITLIRTLLPFALTSIFTEILMLFCHLRLSSESPAYASITRRWHSTGLNGSSFCSRLSL